MDAGILVLEMTQSDGATLSVPVAGGHRRRVSFKTCHKNKTTTFLSLKAHYNSPLASSVSWFAETLSCGVQKYRLVHEICAAVNNIAGEFPNQAIYSKLLSNFNALSLNSEQQLSSFSGWIVYGWSAHEFIVKLYNFWTFLYFLLWEIT